MSYGGSRRIDGSGIPFNLEAVPLTILSAELTPRPGELLETVQTGNALEELIVRKLVERVRLLRNNYPEGFNYERPDGRTISFKDDTVSFGWQRSVFVDGRTVARECTKAADPMSEQVVCYRITADGLAVLDAVRGECKHDSKVEKPMSTVERQLTLRALAGGITELLAQLEAGEFDPSGVAAIKVTRLRKQLGSYDPTFPLHRLDQLGGRDDSGTFRLWEVEYRGLVEYLLDDQDAILREIDAIGRSRQGAAETINISVSQDATDQRKAPTEDRRDSSSEFRLSGEFWTITYEGTTARFKDSKGLRYVAILITRRNEKVFVRDLLEAVDGVGEVNVEGKLLSKMNDSELECHGLSVTRLGNAVEVLDDNGRKLYEKELTDLERRMAETNDPSAQVELAEERDTLKRQYAAAAGRTRNPRMFQNPIERMRKSVSNRIAAAVAKINKSLPPLGRHLKNSLRTGMFCSYQPDKDVHWNL